SVTESQRDHLHCQLNLAPMSDADRGIALAIIDAVNGNGLLGISIEELLETCTQDGEPFELDEIVAVLHRIQQFDPPGVAALDLRDCLLIQLGQLSVDTPQRELARGLIDRHLDAVAEGDYAGLARRLDVPEEDIRAAVRLVQTLTPRPGDSIRDIEANYVTPDVSVRKQGGRWLVTLNNEFT